MKLTIDAVKEVLAALTGYEATVQDEYLIRMAIEERTDYVLSYCNRNDIPKRLRTQLLRMICGEFLYLKKSVYGPDAIGLDALPLISNIVIQDTTTSFSTSGQISPEEALDNLIDAWRNGNRVTLQEYRRLK